jgi:hypothetical protein
VQVAGKGPTPDTYPIRTVGRPKTLIPPQALMSPRRAAGNPPTRKNASTLGVTTSARTVVQPGTGMLLLTCAYSLEWNATPSRIESKS